MFSSVSTELANALDNEIDAEKRLESDNLGGSSSPTVPGFNVTANDAEVRLTKTYGNEKFVLTLIYLVYKINIYFIVFWLYSMLIIQ